MPGCKCENHSSLDAVFDQEPITTRSIIGRVGLCQASTLMPELHRSSIFRHPPDLQRKIEFQRKFVPKPSFRS